MAKYAERADAEIARRLDTAPGPGSPNRITAEQLRNWPVAYLDEYDEELARFPEAFTG